MRHLMIMIALLTLSGVWAQDNEGAPAASNAPAAVVPAPAQSVEFGGKTQLYIDWIRPLTAAEVAFLATVPEGCDRDGQSFKGVVEACFRANIPHVTAPYYSWKDRNGVVYNYAYYCRLLQPADAPHTWRLCLPTATLPGLGELPPVEPAKKLEITPAVTENVALDFLPIEGKDVLAVISSPVCRSVGGAIERGNPASEVREPIGAATLVPTTVHRICKPPSPSPDGTCGPGTPNPPPPPSGAPAEPPDNPGGPTNPITPPGVGPPAPDVPDHGTSGQPWDLQPDHPNVADPVE